MKLKYIDQINGFWQFYDLNKDKISISEITCYFTLLRYCNKINWINPFFIDFFLLSQINPLSKNTYYKSLEVLNNLKIIHWQKGKHNVSYQQITIIKFENSINNSIENSIKFSLVNSIENSIGTNINTIIQSDHSTIYTQQIDVLKLEIENLKKQLQEKPKKEKQNFEIPTLNLIENYFKEIGLNGIAKIESEKFFNFYESKNWFVGKNKMKNWQAACRNWKTNIKNLSQSSKDISIYDKYPLFAEIEKRYPNGKLVEHIYISGIYRIDVRNGQKLTQA